MGSSIAALCGNGKKPSNKKISSGIQVSWNGYKKDIVEENNSEQNIVIGKSAAKNIKTDLQGLRQVNCVCGALFRYVLMC